MSYRIHKPYTNPFLHSRHIVRIHFFVKLSYIVRIEGRTQRLIGGRRERTSLLKFFILNFITQI